MKGQAVRALPHYQEAASLFSISDRRNAGIIFTVLGRAYELIGNLNKASQSYREGVELLTEARDPLVGKAIAWRSRLAPSVQYSSQANHAIVPSPDADSATSSAQQHEILEDARAQQKMGHVYRQASEWEQAIQAYEKAAELFGKLPEIRGMAVCWESVGDMYQLNRQWTQARQAYEKALRFYQRMEDHTAVDNVMDKLRGVVRLESVFKRTHRQADGHAAQDVAARHEEAQRLKDQARAEKANGKQAAKDTGCQTHANEATEGAPVAAEQPAVPTPHPKETIEVEDGVKAVQVAEPPSTEQSPEVPVMAQKMTQERGELVQVSVAQDATERAQAPSAGHDWPKATDVESGPETVQIAAQPATEPSPESQGENQEVAEEPPGPLQVTEVPGTLEYAQAGPSTGEEMGSGVVDAEFVPSPPAAQPDLPDFLNWTTQAKGIAKTKVSPVFLRLALLPVSKDRVAAGKPIIPLGRNTNYITATTLNIDDTDFYLRDIFSGGGEPRIDSFNFAVLIKGCSMEPTIHDGDCVLVRKVESSEGDIVLIRIPGGPDEDGMTVKRFYSRQDDHILLVPDNQEEDAIVIVESEALTETVQKYYPEWAGRSHLQVIVGPEVFIEGKVVAVLSPKLVEPEC
jgi:tetratricopeptide (TPR) repeat protein